jgi:aromatic-L-amino-acid decarboxylase
MTGPSPELEPDADAMRRLVAAALERIVAHVESLPRQPAADVEGAAEAARALVERLPETGAPLDGVLDLLFERAVPKSFNTAGPGYLAYIPGGGLFHAAVADLIADAVNRYVGVWQAAPALSQLEANVTRWFCDLVGYPEGSLGLLTSGGSLANFVALATARRERLPEDFLRGVLYASDQTHHSVQKTARLAGFPAGSVREVPSDGRFRMRADARVYLTGTVAHGRFVLRICVLSFRTHQDRMTAALEDIRAASAEVLPSRVGL